MENQELKRPYDLLGESKNFAYRSILLYQHLTEKAKKREYNLSKQFLMAGTRIGDLVRQEKHLEAYYAASSAQYWLQLLNEGHYVNDDVTGDMLTTCDTLAAYLYVISHPEARKDKETSATSNSSASTTSSTTRFQKGGAR